MIDFVVILHNIWLKALNGNEQIVKDKYSFNIVIKDKW
jgi:hypothetical protein